MMGKIHHRRKAF